MTNYATISAVKSAPSPTKFAHRLREIGMFFDGTDAVHQTTKHVTSIFESAGIAYAIVGGMAVNAHRHGRTTKDVDFLVSTDGWTALKTLVARGDFEAVAGRPRRFVDPQTGVAFDILITGGFPGSGLPGPIAYPDPKDVSLLVDDLRVVNLPTLIQLKLAAGRYQDFADVVNLIRENKLDESFCQKLAPSVQRDFIECLEEMRRENEYEVRQDQNAQQQDDQ
jgi:hypothetical protein